MPKCQVKLAFLRSYFYKIMHILYFFVFILTVCFSQTPPEHRGLCSKVLSIHRAPVAPVIPGLCFFSFRQPRAVFFLMSSPGFDPGIQINNKANLLTWIAGSSPAMTIEKKVRQ